MWYVLSFLLGLFFIFKVNVLFGLIIWFAVGLYVSSLQHEYKFGTEEEYIFGVVSGIVIGFSLVLVAVLNESVIGFLFGLIICLIVIGKIIGLCAKDRKKKKIKNIRSRTINESVLLINRYIGESHNELYERNSEIESELKSIIFDLIKEILLLYPDSTKRIGEYLMLTINKNLLGDSFNELLSMPEYFNKIDNKDFHLFFENFIKNKIPDLNGYFNANEVPNIEKDLVFLEKILLMEKWFPEMKYPTRFLSSIEEIIKKIFIYISWSNNGITNMEKMNWVSDIEKRESILKYLADIYHRTNNKNIKKIIKTYSYEKVLIYYEKAYNYVYDPCYGCKPLAGSYHDAPACLEGGCGKLTSANDIHEPEIKIYKSLGDFLDKVPVAQAHTPCVKQVTQ